jgi:hypothetical protein
VPAREVICSVSVQCLLSFCPVPFWSKLEVDSGAVGCAFMDESLNAILDGLPAKSPRSRLEPYREFIEELRRRGRTYRDIAGILAEKCQVQVSASGVHDFVRTRSRRDQEAHRRSSAVAAKSTTARMPQTIETQPPATTPAVPVDEVRRKIAALKVRTSMIEPAPEGFRFDPSEPLRLKKPDKK